MVNKKSQSGFTLIELIVSLGVFSVVITVAVGALLMLVAANEQLQGEQSVMTNLSFALDSMTRELRTGTNYHCRSASSYDQHSNDNMFDNGNDLDNIYDFGNGDRRGNRDCQGRENNWPLHGLSFEEGGDSISGASDRIVYFHDNDRGQIFRRVGTEERLPITSSGLYIHDADFYVTGSKPVSDGAPNHADQASVTIVLMVSATSTSPAEDIVTVQTTVSQRTLDI